MKKKKVLECLNIIADWYIVESEDTPSGFDAVCAMPESYEIFQGPMCEKDAKALLAVLNERN